MWCGGRAPAPVEAVGLRHVERAAAANLGQAPIRLSDKLRVQTTLLKDLGVQNQENQQHQHDNNRHRHHALLLCPAGQALLCPALVSLPADHARKRARRPVDMRVRAM